MLDMYLGTRPVADDVNLDQLAIDLEGFSGADIKYICDRAAVVPFLKSVAGGSEIEIDLQIISEVVADAPRSVTPAILERFDAWSRETL
jgi:SpoVK/Ycf46/Vps4 family AAA+-type ATPase